MQIPCDVCGQPWPDHELHEEHPCPNCCRVCGTAPDPEDYLPTVFVHLALEGIASDIDVLAGECRDMTTTKALAELAGRVRKACETRSV